MLASPPGMILSMSIACLASDPFLVLGMSQSPFAHHFYYRWPLIPAPDSGIAASLNGEDAARSARGMGSGCYTPLCASLQPHNKKHWRDVAEFATPRLYESITLHANENLHLDDLKRKIELCSNNNVKFTKNIYLTAPLHIYLRKRCSHYDSEMPDYMDDESEVDITSLDPFRNLSIALVDLLGALGENNLQSLSLNLGCCVSSVNFAPFANEFGHSFNMLNLSTLQLRNCPSSPELLGALLEQGVTLKLKSFELVIDWDCLHNYRYRVYDKQALTEVIVRFLASLQGLEDLFLLLTKPLEWHLIANSIVNHQSTLKRLVLHDRDRPKNDVVDGGIPWQNSGELLFHNPRLSCFGTSGPVSEMESAFAQLPVKPKCRILHIKMSWIDHHKKFEEELLDCAGDSDLLNSGSGGKFPIYPRTETLNEARAPRWPRGYRAPQFRERREVSDISADRNAQRGCWTHNPETACYWVLEEFLPLNLLERREAHI
ncbi:hypothetical protein V490_00369 [Pseudogymnoascus sp. VKM F-3557]|nr:hypothetical protein V490_00369 [Pseudogymnoascus sp. VKM F-3557]